MYSTLQLATKYLFYYIHAANGKGHGIHSPFVFGFVQQVLNDRHAYPAYQQVEQLRHRLRHDNRTLQVHDMGAGSGVSKGKQKRVSTIARSVVKPRKWAQMLFRLIQYYQPQTILELGTSLGITTSYLALANPRATLVTLEGSDQISAIAQQNFSALSLSGIRLVQGHFDDTLPAVLQQLRTIDLAFIDGNHAKDPTLRYFHQLLGRINPFSIVIFDDIHWSPEMEAAWNIIKAHPAVTLSIDLFFIGIVFFREEFKVKQHFVIRY